MNVMNIVENVHICIVARCRYNLDVANAINSELFADDLTTVEFLHQNKKVVSSCHLGTSLNFSLYLMVKLKELGIPSMLICTQTDEGQKICVAYEFNGLWYVDDIAEDIKFLTNLDNKYAKRNQLPSTFKSHIRNKFKEHYTFHCAIPLELFKKRNSGVEMFADIFSFNGKMSDYLKTGHAL